MTECEDHFWVAGCWVMLVWEVHVLGRACPAWKVCSDCAFRMKVILLQMELITSTDVVRNLCKKMAPPLVTLLSAEPEIQYVALRNINLIVQRRPVILSHEIKVCIESSFLDMCCIEAVLGR